MLRLYLTLTINMNERTKAKLIKLCIGIILIFSAIFTLMFIMLRYHVEGETNLPFKISKIVIVSSTDGIEENSSENKWTINVNQNNDIYLYLDKNKNYGKTEIIDEVKLSNFIISKENNIKIYKPASEESKMFNNIQELETDELIYKGELESNIKQLKISNQGGLMVFRCANNNVSKYIYNDAQEVNYNNLLKDTNVNEEDLKFSVSFDISIKIANKKTYQATVTLDLPVEGVVEKGTTNIEITDMKNIVFKVM